MPEKPVPTPSFDVHPTLTPGARVGSYEVVALIGAGGMGEVYRARDSRLGRDVALKILPGAFVEDADRVARFQREARTLASLNHPNIAQIYGLEERALAMELVEGEDLSATMTRGAIPLADVLPIARQIADALDAAHELGIIHRDLKPANIKVREDGTVKVLDFGLAKAVAPDATSGIGSRSISPTFTATQMGMIIGTAAYMSPEQARGKAVDRRADIWAFGVVLYEMLTGRRAFEGDEISDILASVLKDTPSLDLLPPDTPPSIRRLLRRCLERDRARRLGSIQTARLEIDDAQNQGDSPLETRTKSRPFRFAAIASGVALVAAFAGGATVWRAMRTEPPAAARLAITPAPDQPISIESNHNDLAIAPDGSHVVYLSRTGDTGAFIVRPLDQFDAGVLNKLGPQARGKGQVRGLFISHDGQWIGFQAGSPADGNSQLFKIPVAGGAPVLIGDIQVNLRGASWAGDDTIVFAAGGGRLGVRLFRIAARGGKAEALATRGDDEVSHAWPSHLPDGKHVLFSLGRADGTWDVALFALDTKTWRVLIKNGTSPRYVSSGHIVYATDGALRAVAFDLGRLEVRGDPIEVQAGVLTKESGAANFAVSDNGTLVYMPGGPPSTGETLVWQEPDGSETPLRVPPQNFSGLFPSPDGRLIAAPLGPAQKASLWVIDVARETMMRLTPPDIPVQSLAWSHDSRQIVFGTPAVAGGGLFSVMVTGADQPRRLTTASEGRRHGAGDFTPDDRQIVFADVGTGSPIIKLLTLGPPVAEHTLLSGPTTGTALTLSPNGKWLAYQAGGAAPEVFVRPFPNVNDARILVSTGRGVGPIWSRDGRQLYYRQGPREIFVVTVDEKPAILFSPPAPFLTLDRQGQVMLPPIGGRILKAVPPAASSAPPTEYRVILNWTEELRRRVP